MHKLIFSDNLIRVFSKPENDLEGFQQMLRDFNSGIAVFDENGEVVSEQKINDKINRVCFDILGFEEGYKPSKRDIKRAMERHGKELMEVLEESIDFKVTTGLEENDFFEQFVERKTAKDGQKNEFWNEGTDVILSVGKISGDHHDLTMQKLGEGKSFSVTTSVYGVKVGMDIDSYLLGRKSWSKFTEAVAIAFQEEYKMDMLSAVMGMAKKLPNPEQFIVTKEITKENKPRFDELLSDVSTANGGCEVMIMGLGVDLKKLTEFADVQWASEGQKAEMVKLGRLGSYESTDIIEIPQRFVKNDVTKKLITPGKLLIIPKTETKWIKQYEIGETEIYEVTEKGQRRDDFMTYEVQREMGYEVVLDRYFGEWNIA